MTRLTVATETPASRAISRSDMGKPHRVKETCYLAFIVRHGKGGVKRDATRRRPRLPRPGVHLRRGEAFAGNVSSYEETFPANASPLPHCYLIATDSPHPRLIPPPRFTGRA